MLKRTNIEEQPFHKLLKTLEESMGRNAYLKWLAEKFPHLSENPIAMQNRAMASESELKDALVENLFVLENAQILQKQALEKFEMLQITNEYAEKIKNFNNLDADFRNEEAKKIEKYKLEQEMINQMKAYVTDRIPLIQIRLEIVREEIKDLKSSRSLLSNEIKNDLTERSKFINDLIKLIPDSGQQLSEVKLSIKANDERVNKGSISLAEANKDFNQQINIIREYHPELFDSLEKKFDHINDSDHDIIEKIDNMSKMDSSIEELEFEVKDLLSELDDLNDLNLEIDLQMNSTSPKKVDLPKAAGSTLGIQMAFMKNVAEKNEKNAEKVKTPDELNSTFLTILNKANGSEDRLAARLARKNALKERLNNDDAPRPSYITSNLDKPVEAETQHGNRLGR